MLRPKLLENAENSGQREDQIKEAYEDTGDSQSATEVSYRTLNSLERKSTHNNTPNLGETPQSLSDILERCAVNK